MESKSLGNNQTLDIINIPKIAYRSFIYIAERNSLNGSQLQTLCYLLGPVRKTNTDEVWIDQVIIPKQICSVSSVEDDGIEDKDTITFLKEHSITKKKEIFAWVHSRSPGQNSCEFSYSDMHTQYVLEKYVSKNIIGIIIEIRKNDYIWNAMRLNIFGTQRLDYCGRNFNTPFESHKWCDCECLYDSCRSSIKVWDEIPFGKSKVIVANYLEGSGWDIAVEPPFSESEEENPEEEVSCECCEKKLKQSSLMRHISHNEECKIFYGSRMESMKKRKDRHRKRKSRKNIGSDKELKKQRDSYQLKCEMKLEAQKKANDQKM